MPSLPLQILYVGVVLKAHGVIALGYALKPRNGRGGSGLLFLNPRQAEDYDLILRLFRQNEIQIIFFSADTKRSFMVEIDYGDQARAEYKKILSSLLATLTEAKISGSYDPDFEKAKQELLKLHPAKSLFPR